MVAAWIVVGVLMGALYFTARCSVMNEIGAHAMGTAIAVAAALSPEDLEAIRNPADVGSAAFTRVQKLLGRVYQQNPDVRYLYTMRRAAGADRPGALEFIVDGPASDRNGNGQLDRSELSESPGTPYDASSLPAMQDAWQRPSADSEITPDPPYPDLLSGYAPVQDADGRTVAIVGADITATTIARKLRAVRLVIGAVFFLFGLLLTVIILLYQRQREALEHIRQLSRALGERNELLRKANDELLRLNQRYEEELKLAQNVQMGFLPKTLPRHQRMAFDRCFVTCAMLGGDLYDVFNLDADRVAMYVADVSGHGAGAALISSLLKMAVDSMKREVRSGSPANDILPDLGRPETVVRQLNDWLMDELPEDKFVTLLYAVFDLQANSCQICSAGHPGPVCACAATGNVDFWSVPGGPALGLCRNQTYSAVTLPVQSGDKILLYTDGLTEAMNSEREEFGEQRLKDVLLQTARRPGAVVITALTEAVAAHRDHCEINDDFTLLLTEIK